MKTFILALILITLISCGSKDDYVKDYSDFIDNVLGNYKSFGDEEWKNCDSLFKEYSEEKYNEYVKDCSDEEIVLLNQLDAVYLGLKAKVEAEYNLRK